MIATFVIAESRTLLEASVVWIATVHESLVGPEVHVDPEHCVLEAVGLIRVGVLEPITTLTVPLYAEPFNVHVMVPGLETSIDAQVGPLTATLLLCRLFHPNPVADGEAVFVALGNEMTMVPLAGMVVLVVNCTVCFATIGTMSVSVPA
jgi:hypothetical protein